MPDYDAIVKGKDVGDYTTDDYDTVLSVITDEIVIALTDQKGDWIAFIGDYLVEEIRSLATHLSYRQFEED